MKITVNREEPATPPVKSITVEFSVDQLRFIRYLALHSASAAGTHACASLYKVLTEIPELAVPINYDVRF